MATNTRQDQERNARPRQTSAKKRKAKSKRKAIILIAEIVVIVVMLAALYQIKDLDKNPINRVEIKEEDISINEPVKENETMKGYRNIALFGVDSTGGALESGTRSDSMIIASINQDTGDVKLLSVYRDTYLNLSNDKYQKCNAAYMKGGAKMAITMLNMNLDLNITDFVTVGFRGLKDTIDALGGIYIDIDSEELKHINNYQKTMSENLKCTYKKVESEGYQLLDGLQAVAYCRIRYTKGDDFKRAERQREVLQAIAETTKKADIKTLTKIANAVAGDVYTSLQMEEILSLLADVSKYNVVDEAGFPNQKYLSTGKLGSDGDCVLPLDLEKNVIWAHEFLFGDKNYETSSEVKEFSKKIRDAIAVYQPNITYPE